MSQSSSPAQSADELTTCRDELTQLREARAQLEAKVASLTSEFAESHEQQVATSEILHVIASSPTELQPVLDVIAKNAIRVCSANDAHIYHIEGDFLKEWTHRGPIPGLEPDESLPLNRGSVIGRAIVDRQTIQVRDADVELDEAEYPVSAALQRRWGYRTVLATPLLREGEPIGGIAIRRKELQPFTEKQVSLLETFADQAVIAIQNVQLFNELQTRNRELARSVKQLQALSDVGQVVSTSLDLQQVLTTIVAHAVQLSGTDGGAIYEFEQATQQFHLRATHQMSEELIAAIRERRIDLSDSVMARAAQSRAPVQVSDIQYEPDFPLREVYERAGFKALLVAPLMREEQIVGALAVRRKTPGEFPPEIVQLLQTFATQSALAIHNARLYHAVAEQRRELEQLYRLGTAIQEPLSLQDRLNSILRGVQEVMGFDRAVIWLPSPDELALELAAWTGYDFGESDARRVPLDEGIPVFSKVYREQAEIVFEGNAPVPDEFRVAPEYRRMKVVRSRNFAVLPLISRGRSVGMLAVDNALSRKSMSPNLHTLRIFAANAAIAIDTAQLFAEIEEQRGHLEQLYRLGTAMQESLSLSARLDLILRGTQEVMKFDRAIVYLPTPDERYLAPAATVGFLASDSAELRFPIDGGIPILTKVYREQVELIFAGSEPIPTEYRIPEPYAHIRLLRSRNPAVVPLISRGRTVGILAADNALSRRPMRPNREMLRIFTANAAIAIETARLFQEIEEKNRQLEVASRHKSEFLANMSHELRTPLNAIIGFSEVLLEKYFGELNPKQEDYLKDILTSGRHLLSLINDILDLSKVEAGRMELERTTFDLRQALESGLMMMRERAARHDIALRLNMADDFHAINADERKLKQVIFNLLSNAVKFTPDGGQVGIDVRRIQPDHSALSTTTQHSARHPRPRSPLSPRSTRRANPTPQRGALPTRLHLRTRKARRTGCAPEKRAVGT